MFLLFYVSLLIYFFYRIIIVCNTRQKMLDEDRRDVRILKEMLFEDGELHSDAGGRERQFRWKNVGQYCFRCTSGSSNFVSKVLLKVVTLSCSHSVAKPCVPQILLAWETMVGNQMMNTVTMMTRKMMQSGGNKDMNVKCF